MTEARAEKLTFLIQTAGMFLGVFIPITTTLTASNVLGVEGGSLSGVLVASLIVGWAVFTLLRRVHVHASSAILPDEKFERKMRKRYSDELSSVK